MDEFQNPGKGSRYRPIVDRERFERNWERIFSNSGGFREVRYTYIEGKEGLTESGFRGRAVADGDAGDRFES